jgi:hypothetical protein
MNIYEQSCWLLIASFGVSGMSLFLTKSQILKALRDWIDWEPFRCFYCMSHWVAWLTAYWLYRSIPIATALMFVLVAMSTIISGGILRLVLWQEQELHELRELLKEVNTDEPRELAETS